MSKARTILAYELTGQDDDSYMLGEETFEPASAPGDWRFGREGLPHPATCTVCGGKIDAGYVNPQYRVKKRRRDLTATYDGYLLASARLCEVLKERGAGAADFVALPADPGYFWLRPTAVLGYSAEECLRRCDSCGQFADAVVPVPLFLAQLVQPLSPGGAAPAWSHAYNEENRNVALGCCREALRRYGRLGETGEGDVEVVAQLRRYISNLEGR